MSRRKVETERSTYIGNFFEPQEITRLVIENNVEKRGKVE